jgi:hypothetical protein
MRDETFIPIVIIIFVFLAILLPVKAPGSLFGWQLELPMAGWFAIFLAPSVGMYYLLKSTP